MSALAATQMLAIWEAATDLHPLDQALTILAAAFPHQTASELAALSVGRRDGLLLDIYGQTFGAAIGCLATCVHCNELLEFTLDANLFANTNIPDQAPAYELALDGYELHFRLPNSFDLASIAVPAASEPEKTMGTAYQKLISRCVLSVVGPDSLGITRALPDPIMAALALEMSKHDPQAEIQLDLVCPACGQHWHALLDIVTFLWANIQAVAQRLLSEVDRLARAYGWHERDILAMNPIRRRYYLDVLL
jgi:hypothetical protein